MIRGRGGYREEGHRRIASYRAEVMSVTGGCLQCEEERCIRSVCQSSHCAPKGAKKNVANINFRRTANSSLQSQQHLEVWRTGSGRAARQMSYPQVFGHRSELVVRILQFELHFPAVIVLYGGE